MENTTAVIHGEFMQQTPREMVDKDYEDVISHELFHHWFGDVVTCESWANLPLNESFATYGEYMWREFKYGRESADEHGQEQLGSYLAESKSKQVDLVRFHYDRQEDMFDSHSYAKGGRVLHMLRKTIGDSAFYQGLSLYLRTHQFKSVEMHQLRLAMEEVSGQDLNWFFNQWFFSKGHPVLRFETGYDSGKGEAVVTVTQQQDLGTTPLYTLKFAIDLYYLGQLHRKQVVLTDEQQTFRFKVPTRPDLINVDAEKMLLCVKNEKKSDAEWMFQFRNAPLFLDRSEALTALTQSRDSLAAATVLAALDDHNPSIRTQAIEGIKGAFNFTPNNVTNKLSSLAVNDPKAMVRGAALDFLAKYAADRADLPRLCEKALKDSSYQVNGIALTALGRIDEAKALSLATGLEAEARGALISAIGGLYARKGGADKLDFFRTAYARIADPGQKYLFIQLMGKFVLKQDDAVRTRSLPTLRELALNESAWYLRLSTLQVLSEMMMNAQGNQALSEAIMKIVQEVKATETDENILNFLGGK
jgi:aminopeptidase N